MDHFQRLYDTTVRTLDGLSGNGYGKEQDDRLRQEGTLSTLNGEKVKWNKGNWVPTNEYKKPRKLENVADNITDNITHALTGDLGNGHVNTVRDRTVKTIGGAAHYVNNNIIEPLKTVSEDYGNGHYEPNGAGENLAVGIGSGLRLAEWGLDKAGDAGEYVGNHLDTDPRASRFIGEEVLTALATAGSSVVAKQGLKVANKLDNLIPPNTPRFVTANGGLHLQIPTDVTPDLSPQVMKEVTIDNPQVASVTGRKVGDEIIANDPGLAKHLVERKAKIQKYENRIETNQEALLIARQEGDAAKAKSADKAIKRTRPKKYSAESNIKPFTKDDPQLYDSSNRVALQDAWEKTRAKKYGDIKNQVEAHHLVLKGGTASAFRKMEKFVAQGKAHMDDVVTMFEYAEKRGAAPGDRLSNNAFQLKTPHNELHQKVLKKKDKSGLAAELDQEGWDKVLREIKTPEQLMEWWVDQVDNNYVPNKASGKIWQDLDDLIKEVQNSK